MIRLLFAARAAGVSPASVRVGRAALACFPPAQTSSIVNNPKAGEITVEDVLAETGGIFLDKLREIERKTRADGPADDDDDDEEG